MTHLCQLIINFYCKIFHCHVCFFILVKIQNDKMANEQFEEFLYLAFTNMCDNLKAGGAFYVWYASRNVVAFMQALTEAGLDVKQEIIWNKSSLVLGRQDYQWKHEPCLYGWKEGSAHYFVDDRTKTTVLDPPEIDINKMKAEDMRELLKKIYDIPTTIINEDKPAASREHPTMKPLKLLAHQIKNSSKVGQRVLDLFAGAGSTLMTCEQLGRISYNMELDPAYCDVIINRWEEYTGRKAKCIKKKSKQ